MEAMMNDLVQQYGYFAIFCLMILNGMTSAPSSPLVYLPAGYFVAVGPLDFSYVVLSGTAGNTIGNMVVYYIVRRCGLEQLFDQVVFLKKRRVAFDHFRRVFDRGNVKISFMGKFVPVVKVFVPVAAAVCNMKQQVFLLVIVAASTIWAVGVVLHGYYLTTAITETDGKTQTILIALGLLSLPLVVWWFRRQFKTLSE